MVFQLVNRWADGPLAMAAQGFWPKGVSQAVIAQLSESRERRPNSNRSSSGHPQANPSASSNAASSTAVSGGAGNGAGNGAGPKIRCVGGGDANLHRLARAIAAKVGPQRFHVWFDNSTRLGFRNDRLEICVPNEFIRDWSQQRFATVIQEAAVEIFGATLSLQFNVFPDAFDAADFPAARSSPATAAPIALGDEGAADGPHIDPGTARNAPPSIREPRRNRPAATRPTTVHPAVQSAAHAAPNANAIGRANHKFRHNLSTYVVGPANQLAHNAVLHVAEFPGTQYNPLFIHGSCGLGKTHLLQGLCQQFAVHHPSRKYLYVTGEEFTNDYLLALRTNKVEGFRRRMRDLDLLVIDDVHFLAGKKATQEEFLHTFNAIEALGKQVVMASDAHPKEIAEFGESLINRFVSGMVVRVDPPNLSMRSEILRNLAGEHRMTLSEEVVAWVARRVTQNVRELEGAVTRISAHVMLTGQDPTVELAQQALGDLERSVVAPVKPENVLISVAEHFGIQDKDIMSGRRHHTVSLARSVAMYLIRKTAKLSYPEIGQRMGNRNHSTVISACRRIDTAVTQNEKMVWSGPLGERTEEAAELVQRLEDHARAMA